MTDEVDPNNAEKRLFAAALDLPPGPQRDAWLQGACNGNVAMQLSVHALLEAHEATSFMEERTAVVPEQSHADSAPSLCEKPHDWIGCYRLVERIGEGGFGVVWLADQVEPVKRSVALKISKAGLHTREAMVRFDAEREALGVMQHQNIARVFDAGSTESGA